jgi:hypothetical protein
LVDFYKILSVEIAWPNESKFGRKYPWKVLYKECSFLSNPFTNMAATRPNQLVREVFMFASKFAEISHLTCMWDNTSDFL